MWLVSPVPELVRGRPVVAHPNLYGDVTNMGAIYTDQDVVVDGDLVTGRTGGHCHLFARKIIDILSDEGDEGEAERVSAAEVRDYHRPVYSIGTSKTSTPEPQSVVATYHHMGISCSDMRATERFYTKYFGFRRARVVPLGDTEIVWIKSGNTYLELFQAEGESPLPVIEADGPKFPGWRHIAFEVEDVDAKLAEMGNDARVTLGPLDFSDFIPGWRGAWIADPDGNIIEISQGYVDQENPPQA
jgi:glyoxylase I family protein